MTPPRAATPLERYVLDHVPDIVGALRDLAAMSMDRAAGHDPDNCPDPGCITCADRARAGIWQAMADEIENRARSSGVCPGCRGAVRFLPGTASRPGQYRHTRTGLAECTPGDFAAAAAAAAAHTTVPFAEYVAGLRARLGVTAAGAGQRDPFTRDCSTAADALAAEFDARALSDRHLQIRAN